VTDAGKHPLEYEPGQTAKLTVWGNIAAAAAILVVIAAGVALFAAMLWAMLSPLTF
jgi:type IV secretory pathway VirB2 component (pilin)